MTDQQMSQDKFATYIAQKIRAARSQAHAPQFVALSGWDYTGKSTLAKDVHQQLSRLQRDLPKQNADITATFKNGTWRVTTTFFFFQWRARDSKIDAK